MIKRKREQGFTLIELMIVIAVIGILAIVLVPKVGTIKTQSKSAGIDTNMRVVEGYVQSKIDKWVSSSKTGAQVQTDIVTAFSGSTNALTNPFTSIQDGTLAAGATATGNAAVYVLSTGNGSDSGGLSATTTRGTVVVAVTCDTTSDINSKMTKVTLYTHDTDGKLLSSVEIAP